MSLCVGLFTLSLRFLVKVKLILQFSMDIIYTGTSIVVDIYILFAHIHHTQELNLYRTFLFSLVYLIFGNFFNEYCSLCNFLTLHL